MKKILVPILIISFLFSLLSTIPSVLAANRSKNVQEYIFTLRIAPDALSNIHGSEKIATSVYPPLTDNSMSNPDYSRLRYHWKSIINYFINPENIFGFDTFLILNTIMASANTWDEATSSKVFNVPIIADNLQAGIHDGKNVISWGFSNQANAIAATYIWAKGSKILETDCMLNTEYAWTISTNGAPGTMDLQNIISHEFGHWCGLKDLYYSQDFWLTMYGYAGYGTTNKYLWDLGK